MPGVRINAGVIEGSEVSVHYDPLLAKLITSGESRDAARRRAIAALEQFPILGITTNAPYVREVLRHQRFIDGDLDTHFLDSEHDALTAALATEAPDVVRELADLAASASTAATHGTSRPAVVDPWDIPSRTPRGR